MGVLCILWLLTPTPPTLHISPPTSIWQLDLQVTSQLQMLNQKYDELIMNFPAVYNVVCSTWTDYTSKMILKLRSACFCSVSVWREQLHVLCLPPCLTSCRELYRWSRLSVGLCSVWFSGRLEWFFFPILSQSEMPFRHFSPFLFPPSLCPPAWWFVL